MARTSNTRVVYECVDGFAVWTNGTPEVYSPGRQVFEDDRILRTHGQFFVSVVERLADRVDTVTVEAAVAPPGSLRVATIPQEIKEPTDG
jgi:hypothetical protein